MTVGHVPSSNDSTDVIAQYTLRLVNMITSSDELSRVNLILVFSTITLDFFFFFLNDPAPPEISPFPLPAPLPLPLPHPPRPRPQRPVAGDDQLAPPQRFRLRERFQRQVKSLVRHQPADGDEPKPPARLRPAGRQREPLRVQPVLGDVVPPAAKPARHLGRRVPAAGDHPGQVPVRRAEVRQEPVPPTEWHEPP